MFCVRASTRSLTISLLQRHGIAVRRLCPRAIVRRGCHGSLPGRCGRMQVPGPGGAHAARDPPRLIGFRQNRAMSIALKPGVSAWATLRAIRPMLAPAWEAIEIAGHGLVSSSFSNIGASPFAGFANFHQGLRVIPLETVIGEQSETPVAGVFDATSGSEISTVTQSGRARWAG